MERKTARISKEPEVRRQEILDTAMSVFMEKGYEAATMRDIAAAMHVVPGLCYRYFESKQMLYDTAIEQYGKRRMIRWMVSWTKWNSCLFKQMERKSIIIFFIKRRITIFRCLCRLSCVRPLNRIWRKSCGR